MSFFRLGHVAERRLAELAESAGGAVPSERERKHLDSCTHCRALLTGHRRAARLLRGTLISVNAPKRRVTFRDTAALPVTLVVAAVLTGVLVLGRGPIGGGTTSPPPTGTLSATKPPSSPTGEARIVTTGFDLNPVVWSPSGAAVAVVVRAQDVASAEVRIFKTDGATLATYPASDIAWLDDDHFVTLEPGPTLGAGSLRLRSLDDTTSVAIPGTFASPLSSGQGAVAAGVAPAGDPTSPPSEFVIVTANGAGQGGRGLPAAWSPDGSRLAVLRNLRGRQAELAVVGYPDLKDLPVPKLTVATAPAPVFGPAGQTLAVCAIVAPDEPCRVTLLDTASGRSSETGLTGEAGFMFWLGAAQIAVPNRDFTGLTVWNIDAATEGQPIEGATVAAASSRGVLAVGQLPYGGPTITLRRGTVDRAVDLPGPLASVPVWSPDGGLLALVVGGQGAGSDLVLLSPEPGT